MLLSATLLVGLGLTTAACAPESAPHTAAPTPVPSATTATPTLAPTAIAPLRGTTVPVGSLDHASIAAKIDNLAVARPQVGLGSADLVFQELVEGGLTRYVAV